MGQQVSVTQVGSAAATRPARAARASQKQQQGVLPRAPRHLPIDDFDSSENMLGRSAFTSDPRSPAMNRTPISRGLKRSIMELHQINDRGALAGLVAASAALQEHIEQEATAQTEHADKKENLAENPNPELNDQKSASTQTSKGTTSSVMDVGERPTLFSPATREAVDSLLLLSAPNSQSSSPVPAKPQKRRRLAMPTDSTNGTLVALDIAAAGAQDDAKVQTVAERLRASEAGAPRQCASAGNSPAKSAFRARGLALQPSSKTNSPSTDRVWQSAAKEPLSFKFKQAQETKKQNTNGPKKADKTQEITLDALDDKENKMFASAKSQKQRVNERTPLTVAFGQPKLVSAIGRRQVSGSKNDTRGFSFSFDTR